jgi:hypothetical protein
MNNLTEIHEILDTCSPDIFTLNETNLHDLIPSSAFAIYIMKSGVIKYQLEMLQGYYIIL